MIHRKKSRSALLLPPCLLLVLGPGCGLSDTVNASVRGQEKQLEVEAARQMLLNSSLIVDGVMAQLKPQSTTTCQMIPQTACTFCYTDAVPTQSLELHTPDCSIDTPAQGREVSLKLSLHALSFAATNTDAAPSVFTLAGAGSLDLSAQIPVVGAYRANVSYDVRSGTVDVAKKTVDLDLHLAYSTDGSLRVELSAQVSGSQDQVQGHISGGALDCLVTGALRAPTVTCQ